MRIEDPVLIDALAGEYVLGTLRGRARQRFERLMHARPEVAAAVHAWERRLADLATPTPASLEAPPARVWWRIRHQLAFDTPPRRTVPRRRRRWQGAWQGLAAGVVLAMSTWWVVDRMTPPTVATPGPAYVSVIADGDGATLWLVRVFEDRERLRIRVTGDLAPLDNQVYQLWMLGDDGTPQSLGLLPSAGTLERAVSLEALDALARSTKLAVSTEPPGGSPTGLPTGDVVYVAAIVKG